MFHIILSVLRHPAFFIVSIAYFVLQFIGVFPISYMLTILLILNIAWFFFENWSNPLFKRVFHHGVSALSFLFIIYNFWFAENFSTLAVIITFIAFSVNLFFMAYSSKSNSKKFIKASQIVLFINRLKHMF